MKRTIILFVVATLVIISAGLWLFTSQKAFSLMDVFQFVIVLVVVGFAVFVGYKKLKNVKRGEPAEDELSKKVLLKTAAYSYYISLYIWVFLIFLKDRVTFDTEELLGTGILAMAVTFAVCWIIFNFRGVRNG